MSETYSRKNQNMTPEETIESLKEIVDLARDIHVDAEAGIATSFYGPHEGHIPEGQTLSVVDRILETGGDEVTFATTMGLADPVQIESLLTEAFDRWPDLDAWLHLHDTNGLSVANSLIAMHCGVELFTSMCGLGGGVVLPDALEGVGNTPTEDLVGVLTEMGIETTADFERVESVAEDDRERLDLPANSHVLSGGTVENVLETVSEGET